MLFHQLLLRINLKIYKLLKTIISLLSFFTFNGFYVLLALVISLGYSDYTRSFTVPLRILLILLMLLFISKNLKNLYRNKNTLILLLIFWGIYFFKVMIHFNTNADMSLEWYEYIFYSFSYCVLPFITFILSDFKKFKNVILNSLIFSGFSLGVTSLFLYKHLWHTLV